MLNREVTRLNVLTACSPSGAKTPVVLPNDGEAVRAAIQGVDKGAPLFRVGTMQGWLAESTARSRFTAALLCVFAALALLLSATGLYGVTASYVAMSRRNIGIRMALGANTVLIVTQVLKQGFIQVVLGITVGSGLAASLEARSRTQRLRRRAMAGPEGVGPGPIPDGGQSARTGNP